MRSGCEAFALPPPPAPSDLRCRASHEQPGGGPQALDLADEGPREDLRSRLGRRLPA